MKELGNLCQDKVGVAVSVNGIQKKFFNRQKKTRLKAALSGTRSSVSPALCKFTLITVVR